MGEPRQPCHAPPAAWWIPRAQPSRPGLWSAAVAEAGRHEAAVEKRASPGGVLAVLLFAGLAVAAVVTIVYRQNLATSAPAKANTVVMAQIAFNPKTLTAAKGSEVTFENNDVTVHNVTSLPLAAVRVLGLKAI